MKPLLCLCLAAVLGLMLAGISVSHAATSAAQKTLASFKNETELKIWLEKLRARLESTAKRGRSASSTASSSALADTTIATPAPAASMPVQSMELEKVAEPQADGESVTNVQTAGVDEGGIVKVHGDYLVILRRGRLFTVSLASGGLKPVSKIDAYGPGIDPNGAWYDEMLITGNTIVVIGYSYARGGTEVGLFDIDQTGLLSHRGTYHLRSNDYYSSRNYASRLIGNKLIFYTPLYLNIYGDTLAGFPAMRKWRPNASVSDFKRIAPATRIYRTDDDIAPYGLALHTVTMCDLAKREMECEATGVLGPAGRVFYVSAGSVYVWTTGYQQIQNENRPQSAVFRIPLDGSAPSALKTGGNPIDQFSFLESSDGYLNVLLRSTGRGEAMWGAESSTGATALLRVPLRLFGDGTESAGKDHYRRLPSSQGYNVQNRFIGPYLLYGNGSTWGKSNPPRSNVLHALRWAEPGTVQTRSLPHGVDRIEAMGRHAVVIGTVGKDLLFSSVRLNRDISVPHRFTRENAAQGETRSHGFFYKAEGEENGIVGLPIVGGGRPGYRQLREGSAAVLFLRNEDLLLGELGELTAKPEVKQKDNCRASCVDWYGNARPLFLKNRVFALMGYEIVEGRLGYDDISELRRVSFAPG